MNKKMKIYSILLVLVLTALACSLPGQNAPDPKSLDEDSIETSVAATLAAIDQDDPSAQLPDATQEAGAENTPEAAPPTATIASTATPTETQEPTPTLSPTPPPSDPKLSLGDPDFKDSFNNPNNWTLHDAASSTTEIKNGKFFYTVHNPSPYSDEWVFSWPEIKDFYMEVTATTPASCSGKDRFGLIFRSQANSKGYLFYLSCDGSYKLNYYDGSTMDTLKDWTPADEIEAGPSKANRLGIMTEDNDISLYINGKFIVLIEDDSFINEGKIGFVVAATDTTEFTIAFDDLMYWE